MDSAETYGATRLRSGAGRLLLDIPDRQRLIRGGPPRLYQGGACSDGFILDNAKSGHRNHCAIPLSAELIFNVIAIVTARLYRKWSEVRFRYG